MNSAKRIMSLPKYVGGKPIEELQRELGISNPIKLASNENPTGPSPGAIDIMTKSLSKVSSYPDGDSYYLKRKICEKENLLPNQVVIGNGSNEVLELISHAYIEEGDEVIMGEYCFIVYPIVTMLSEGKIIRSSMPDLTHDIQNIKSLITEKTKVIFIANPNNPTGTKVSKTQIHDLLNSIPKSILVVIDEAYCEYVDETQKMNVQQDINNWENLIVIKTFSKIYGLAGLRVGYGMSNEKIIEKIHKPREPFNVNIIAQVAAAAALDDLAHIEKSQQVNSAGMFFLKTELKKMGLNTFPSYANFILIDFGIPARVIYEELLKKGIIVRPLENYNLPNCLRVTIGTEEEIKLFVTSLKEVLSAIK